MPLCSELLGLIGESTGSCRSGSLGLYELLRICGCGSRLVGKGGVIFYCKASLSSSKALQLEKMPGSSYASRLQRQSRRVPDFKGRAPPLEKIPGSTCHRAASTESLGKAGPSKSMKSTSQGHRLPNPESPIPLNEGTYINHLRDRRITYLRYLP